MKTSSDSLSFSLSFTSSLSFSQLPLSFPRPLVHFLITHDRDIHKIYTKQILVFVLFKDIVIIFGYTKCNHRGTRGGDQEESNAHSIMKYASAELRFWTRATSNWSFHLSDEISGGWPFALYIDSPPRRSPGKYELRELGVARC